MYKDRRITNVAVWGLEQSKGHDGVYVHGTVSLTVSNFNGEEQGPETRIDIGTKVSDQPTIPEAEDALVKAAVAMFGRLSAEPIASLLEIKESKKQSEFYVPAQRD